MKKIFIGICNTMTLTMENEYSFEHSESKSYRGKNDAKNVGIDL